MGNTEPVAMRHYLHVCDGDIEKAPQNQTRQAHVEDGMPTHRRNSAATERTRHRAPREWVM
jgi:hypothetical protein